jgi:hypothetical protein
MSVVLIGVFLLSLTVLSLAHDDDHHELDQWYAELRQPDYPAAGCCGKADAYWCDNYYARDGKAYCKITDDRDDAPLKRPHIDVGTEILIPPHKLKFDRGNPTGHAVIFLTPMLHVLCFVQGSGI